MNAAVKKATLYAISTFIFILLIGFFRYFESLDALKRDQHQSFSNQANYFANSLEQRLNEVFNESALVATQLSMANSLQSENIEAILKQWQKHLPELQNLALLRTPGALQKTMQQNTFQSATSQNLEALKQALLQSQQQKTTIIHSYQSNNQTQLMLLQPIFDSNETVKHLLLVTLQFNTLIEKLTSKIKLPQDASYNIYWTNANNPNILLFNKSEEESSFTLPFSSFQVTEKITKKLNNKTWRLEYHRDLKFDPFYQRSVLEQRQSVWLILLFSVGFAFLVFFFVKDFERLVRTNQDLKFSSLRYEGLLEQTSDIFILIDRNLNIVEVNQEACFALGYTKSEFLSMKIHQINPNSGHGLDDLFENLPLGQKFQAERSYQRKNGSTFPVEVSVNKVEIMGEYFISGLARDLTNHKRQLDVLSTAIEEAKQAEQVKAEFLANMSHELRTPLHGILSFASMGQSRAGSLSEDKTKSYFKAIHQSGERLFNLLTSLLDLSRLEAKKMPFDMKLYLFNQVVSNCIIEQESLIKSKNLTLVKEDIQDNLYGYFDFNRMSQVIANLLSNAIKFTPENGIIKISCTKQVTKQNEDELYFSIKNSGQAIAEEELKTIFNKFVQSKTQITGTAGSGLGLSICKEIVQAHQGNIWAESDQEMTNFQFVIPLNETVSEENNEVS